MLNPFKAIGRFFKRVGVLVGRGFVKVFGSDAAKQFAEAALVVLHSQLGKIVWTVVLELSASAMPGAEKRAEAFRRIAIAAARAGLDARDSIVNMLIELAVLRVKGEFGEAPAEELPDEAPEFGGQ